MQKTAKLIKTTREIEQFIGIQMFIVNFSAYSMYQANVTRYGTITDTMSISRYQLVCEHFHHNDDLKLDELENKSNILFKIHPVLDHVS